MASYDIYQDMATRTGGDVYIGVVGPVRTGKSTFIQKFMDQVVLPRIENEDLRARAVDELPQSSAGRTIMTTEPKFIPESAIPVTVGENITFRTRLIDCVGYIVPSALGYIEEDQPRMVQTPWFEEEVPFNMAAEIGTRKVITEHSTIGLVITTDGSISDIPREEYEEAEERVIGELQEIRKPFVVILNCVDPNAAESRTMAETLSQKYGVPVLPMSCLTLREEDIIAVLGQVLYQFPVREIRFRMPGWVAKLPRDHWLRSAVFAEVRREAGSLTCLREVQPMLQRCRACEYIEKAEVEEFRLGNGCTTASIQLRPDLFFKVLSENTGLTIRNENDLFASLQEFAAVKKEYGRIRSAYRDVQETGYGIVMPEQEELTLQEPEIFRQGGKYGVRLKATAPSIHLMRTQICTELTPIVGNEQQSEEMINYLLQEFEDDPTKIWESNLFGKSLHELVNEGLHNKLLRMPEDARDKVRETIERIINDGCNGLICIIL